MYYPFENSLDAFAACDCAECYCTTCDCVQNWDCGSDTSSTSTINDTKQLAPVVYPNTVLLISTVSRRSK